MKRIVEETLKDGRIRYRVESNRTFFGLLPCKWYTCTVYINNEYSYDIACDAVFDSLKEAEIFADIETNPVIKRVVL